MIGGNINAERLGRVMKDGRDVLIVGRGEASSVLACGRIDSSPGSMPTFNGSTERWSFTVVEKGQKRSFDLKDDEFDLRDLE